MPHNPRRFSDNELHAHAVKHSRNERAQTLIVVVDLGEIERRRSYLGVGCSSLFDYCTQHLGYSRSAAYRRIQAARCLLDYPELHELIENNEVNLTAVSHIAPVLKDTGRRDLIENIRNKTEREVEAIVSAYRPPVALRDRVRPVRVPVATTAPAAPGACEKSNYSRTGTAAGSAGGQPRSDSALLPTAKDRDTTAPASPHPPKPQLEEKYHVQFLASAAFMSQYYKARSLLSNSLGSASFEHVFGFLLHDYLERNSPEKRQARRKKRKSNGKGTPRKPRSAANTPTRRISPAVRDQVFTRDKGRCTYVGSGGRRCGSTLHLEVDHIVPFARGGPNTAANLRLLCAQHNMLEAEKKLGGDRMRQYRRRE